MKRFCVYWCSLSIVASTAHALDRAEIEQADAVQGGAPRSEESARRFKYTTRFDLIFFRIRRLMTSQVHDLSDSDFTSIVVSTGGYSGADIKALCTEAAMGPIRSISDIRTVTARFPKPQPETLHCRMRNIWSFTFCLASAIASINSSRSAKTAS